MPRFIACNKFLKPRVLSLRRLSTSILVTAPQTSSHRCGTTLASVRLPLPMRDDEVTSVEDIIGYKFHNPIWLEEALIHPFYSDPLRRSYENLKIIGGNALRSNLNSHADGDPLVGSSLFDDYSEWGIEPPGRGFEALFDVNLSTQKLARNTICLGLYPFLRCNSPMIDQEVEEFTKALHGDEFPVPKAPDVLPDIIQAVAGAVAEDCQYFRYCQHSEWKPGQVMDRLLHPLIDWEGLTCTIKPLQDICKKYGMQMEMRRDLKNLEQWRKGKRSLLYEEKILVNGKHLGSGYSVEEDYATLIAAAETFWRLPNSMLYGSKLGFLEQSLPLWQRSRLGCSFGS